MGDQEWLSVFRSVSSIGRSELLAACMVITGYFEAGVQCKLFQNIVDVAFHRVRRDVEAHDVDDGLGGRTRGGFHGEPPGRRAGATPGARGRDRRVLPFSVDCKLIPRN